MTVNTPNEVLHEESFKLKSGEVDEIPKDSAPARPRKTENELDELLNYDGAAAFLDSLGAGVSKSTLSIWVCTGRYKVPFIKCGGKVRFRKSSLIAWLRSRERNRPKVVVA